MLTGASPVAFAPAAASPGALGAGWAPSALNPAAPLFTLPAAAVGGGAWEAAAGATPALPFYAPLHDAWQPAWGGAAGWLGGPAFGYGGGGGFYAQPPPAAEVFGGGGGGGFFGARAAALDTAASAAFGAPDAHGDAAGALARAATTEAAARLRQLPPSQSATAAPDAAHKPSC